MEGVAEIARLTTAMLSASGEWDALIVASDHCDVGAHEAAHKASQARGVPWLPIQTEPIHAASHTEPIHAELYAAELGTAVIGPLTRPTRPGCSACFQLRRKHNSPADKVSADDVPEDEVPAEPKLSTLDRLAASLIATLAATELAIELAAEPASAEPAEPAAPAPAKPAEPAPADDTDTSMASVLLVRLDDLTIERHTFLPEPMCPACGGLPGDTPQDARITLTPRPKNSPTQYRLWSPTEHADDIISTYVGTEAGLIHQVVRSDEAGPAVAEASVTLRVPSARVPGGGRTWDYCTSEAVAVLEALERYGGSNPTGKRTVVRAAMADLTEPVLDPRRLGTHEDDVYHQMPHLYRPFTEESVCNWVWGYSLTAERPVLVPESCAYFWTLNHPDPAFLADTTNGCALGSCLEEAIVYGILEVAERDAFLLTWHASIPAPAIDIEAADDREPAIVAAAITQTTGYRVSLFDITTEVGIPCVWAMATHPKLGDGGLPPGTDEIALFCAAGSHLTPERAALSALVELGPQLVDAINRFPARKSDAEASLTCPDVVRTIFDHAVAFGDPRAYSRLDFLTRSLAASRPLAEVGRAGHWPDSADLRDDLLEMISRFRAENLEVIVVDQTGPEHRAMGLCCVRVLIPGTLPLTYGYRRRRLKDLPRLLTLPNRLGHRMHPLSVADVNQLPHPFAA